jgi:putative transposase
MPTKLERRAELSIFEYIEVFYNRQRHHSTLGYLSPVSMNRCRPAERFSSQA